MTNNPTSNNIPWNEIHTVLLDMDGTLLDLHFDNYFWQSFLPSEYAKQNDMELEQALKKIERMYDEKHGLLEWYSVDYWEEQLQMDIMTLKRKEAHRVQYRPHALDFLYYLKDKRVTTALVTNAHPKAIEFKMLHTTLEDLVPFQFSSHDFGFAKEHPLFWPAFAEKFSFEKEHTLFIDDNDSVLNNANLFGIKHLRSIRWPDSAQSKPNDSAYLQIESFADVMV